MNYAPSPDRPLVPVFPYFPATEREILQEDLADILLKKLSMGPRVTRFEADFAGYCGVPYGVAFPSCTSAMEAALMGQGLKPGEEVLVPVQTFIATGMAVYLTAGRPVFTEISRTSFSMDFEDAWSRVTPRTRGAIVVHFGGLIDPAFPRFVERMASTGRFVIEDAAHAHGAELDGKLAGSIGDAGCFSFYPTKIMTTGEGGMFVARDKAYSATVRSLQNRGLDIGSGVEIYARPGRNNRFTEIAAAMGLSQLRCLPDFLAARRAVAATYDEMLREGSLVTPLSSGSRGRPSYWRYTILLPRGVDRETVRSRLAAKQITVDWAYQPPLHLQRVFRELYETKPGMLPRAEELMSRHICLPVHAKLRPEDAGYVAECLIECVAKLLD